MDLHSTPFPGKTRPSKPKTIRKAADSSETIVKEPPISRQKRVFGTARTTNIPVKTVAEKPIIKPKSTQSSTIASNVARNPTENAKPRSKKKSVCFQEKVVQNPEKIPQDDNVVGPRTPVVSPTLNKPKIIGTPYHTAENCSKCRFDRLETSSYWLCQIKLAESVGKHFVSATFFRLAFESKAEPIRNLRVELKRYMARHGYLPAQTEWRDVAHTYGLLKDESNVEVKILCTGKAEASEKISGDISDQDQRKEQSLEHPETKGN